MNKKHETSPEDPFEGMGLEISAEDIAFFAGSRQSRLRSIANVLGGVVAKKLIRPKPVEVRGDVDDSFVVALRNIQTKLQIPETARVVYPGSEGHVGVARVFGRDHVTHVDPNQSAVRGLKKAGYRADAKGIEDHKPKGEKYDVMVALNSYGSLSNDQLKALVKPGGYVIANNYTHWANDIASNTDASLVGAVLPAYNDENPAYVPAEELPSGVTDIVPAYYHIGKEGGVSLADGPGENVFEDESPHYPDGLFVFQMPEQS